MKVKNLNHSSEKTKILIKNSFAELINEHQELNKVTVTELVKRADINRGTFYNHYDSIYDVAEEFEAEIIKILIENSKDLKSNEDIFDYFDSVINYLKENEYIYKLLLSSNAPLVFLEKLNTVISDKLYSYLKDNSKFTNANSLKFHVTFFTDGIVNQVLKYFTSKSEYSLDEINKYIKMLFKTIFMA